jgi:magnesium transporter
LKKVESIITNRHRSPGISSIVKNNFITEKQSLVMARFRIQKKDELGLSPDALHFRGTKKMENTLIHVIDFSKENLIETELANIGEAIKYKDSPTTTWVNIDGIHDRELMQQVADGFAIDPVFLDDVMNTNVRPKMVENDDYIFITLKMLSLNETSGQINYEQLSLFILPHVLITFQERTGDFFEPVRERIRKQRRRIIESGPDYLAFALLDIIIDNYIFILSEFGEKIESFEGRYLSVKNQMKVINLIFNLKKELSYLARQVKPVRELMLLLSKTDSDLVRENSVIHFNELYNNISHAVELLENYREMLSDQLNVYHTSSASVMNDKMKILTIFSVIFIPLTFIVGVYGTNFDNVPELHFKYGYLVMWGIMVLIAATMLWYFKRKKWF